MTAKLMNYCKFFLLTFLMFFTFQTSNSQVPYYKNHYYSYHEGGDLSIACWVPSEDSNYVVKGVFFNGNPGGGNGILWIYNETMQYFAKKYQFALAATSGNYGSNTYYNTGSMFLRAFNAWAEMGHNPDLKHAPFVILGNSSAGAFTYGMSMLVPDRTICYCSNVPATLVPDMAPEAGLDVPGILSCGEVDPLTGNFETGTIGDRMRKNRPRGAVWSKLEIQGMGHEHRRTIHLYYPFMEKLIQQRLPQNAKPRLGPVALNPVDPASGWIADDQTIHSGCTDIFPIDQFPADRDTAESSWLLDKDMAYLHRAYSSRDIKLHIATPDTIPWDIEGAKNTDVMEYKLGDSVKIVGKTKNFNDWTKIELYHLSNKIDEVTGGGETFSFDVYLTNKPRYSRTYSVIGYDTNGDPWPSHMYTIMAYGGDITNPDSIPPSPPGNTQISNQELNSFTISWNEGSDNEQVDGYFVYVDGVQMNDSALTDTFMNINGLTIDSEYEVIVRTRDEAGNLSPPTNSTNASTINPSGFTYLSDLNWISAENGLGPVEKDMTNGDEAAFDGEPMILDSINYPKGLGVYAPSEITYDLDGNYTYFYSEVNIDNLNASWVTFEVFLDGELAYTSPYYMLNADTVILNVKGVDEMKLVVSQSKNNVVYYGNWAGAFLLDDAFTSDTENPDQPAGLTSSNVTGNGFDLSWQRSRDDFMATDYVIYVDGNPYDTTSLIHYTFDELDPETTYSVSVKAMDALGHESTVSSTIDVTTEAASSTSLQNIHCNIYPNPFKNAFVVQTNEKIQDIFVYNLLGIKVYETAVSERFSEIDLAGFSNGQYVIKGTLVSGKSFTKLIIKH